MDLSQWASAHPLAMAFVWPLLTALVTTLFAIFGHLSQDGFSKLPPWLRPMAELFARSGLDAPAVMQLLARLFGRAGTMMLLVITGWVSLASLLSACALLTPRNVHNAVLAVDDTKCVIANADQPLPVVLSRCHLAEDLAQIVADLMATARASRPAALCYGDAGADADAEAGH